MEMKKELKIDNSRRQNWTLSHNPILIQLSVRCTLDQT